MTYSSLIQKFLQMISKIKSLNPAYKQPGDGSNGVCDCIGLIIGAIRRMGLKWTGIHGSNYAARFQTDDLKYISNASQLKVGDIVYKAANPDSNVKLAENTGYKTHKYDLPRRYYKGNSYYNGDIKDYYHVGVVTKINPLNITHMTSPHIMVDTTLKGGWNYFGRAKPIVNASDGQISSTPTQKPTAVQVPNAGSHGVVCSDNGLPVKMREYPSTSCRTWIKLTVGTKVTIVEPGEEWTKIDAGGRSGWYMMAKFIDVVGDGKGKY